MEGASVESYEHKIAKELLYKQIVEARVFRFKTDGEVRQVGACLDNHGVWLEFPSADGGHYPDEMACNAPMRNNLDLEFYTEFCRPWRNATPDLLGIHPCSKCRFLNRQQCKIHDIAAAWKGGVDWAIEVVHKHYPDWLNDYEKSYEIYIVKARSIMNRTSNSPVYVERIL